MSDTWKESGAMVYVALTIATFAAVLTCCIWISKKKKSYNPVESSEEEEVELTGENYEHKTDPKFTFEDSEEEEEIDLGLHEEAAETVEAV